MMSKSPVVPPRIWQTKASLSVKNYYKTNCLPPVARKATGPLQKTKVEFCFVKGKMACHNPTDGLRGNCLTKTRIVLPVL